MDWYYYIALAVIVSQLLLSFQAYRNYRYALAKYKKKRLWHQLRTVLIVPCKGQDCDFQKNITSFFNQDYENYLLWFVVAEKSDPAYAELCKLKNQLSQSSKAHEVQILVAGTLPVTRDPWLVTRGSNDERRATSDEARGCSQKIHNLLYCYQRIGQDVDVLAFADSDICVRRDWLSHLVWPLRQSKNGAASGYRWFIPKKNNLASLALSAVNGSVAQLLGNSRFNQAWGGSMAIRVDVFRRLSLDKIWPKSLSDDLSLSYAVKKAGLKITFVPACLAASHEQTTWRGLFEFGRRQFLITRIYAPSTWWLGLCGSLYAVLGVWGAAGLAIYAATNFEFSAVPLFTAVPIVFLTVQFSKAIMRQKMISRLLKEDLPQMKVAMTADILGFWAWSLLLLSFIISSAFGRTILWRGIRYKISNFKF